MPRKLMVSASTACSVCEMTSPMPCLASAVLLLEVLDAPPHLFSCVWNWLSSPVMLRMSNAGFSGLPAARSLTTSSTESLRSSERRRENVGVTYQRTPSRNASRNAVTHAPRTHDGSGATTGTQAQGSRISNPRRTTRTGRLRRTLAKTDDIRVSQPLCSCLLGCDLFCDHKTRAVCRKSLILGTEQLLQVEGRERPRSVKSLAVVAAELAEQRVLLRGLDAFGDHPEREAARERYARGDDRRVVGAHADVAHERAVHLECPHGKALEVVESRVPRAEIVDREADAERPQRLQRRLGARIPADHDALGDLELDGRRRDPGLGQRARYRLHQLLIQLARRHVDAHPDRTKPGGLPGLGLGDRRLEDPGADRLNQPRLLGERYELRTRHPAELGVAPADQRLDRADLSVREADLRLVVHLEVTVLDGPP